MNNLKTLKTKTTMKKIKSNNNKRKIMKSNMLILKRKIIIRIIKLMKRIMIWTTTPSLRTKTRQRTSNPKYPKSFRSKHKKSKRLKNKPPSNLPRKNKKTQSLPTERTNSPTSRKKWRKFSLSSLNNSLSKTRRSRLLFSRKSQWKQPIRRIHRLRCRKWFHKNFKDNNFKHSHRLQLRVCQRSQRQCNNKAFNKINNNYKWNNLVSKQYKPFNHPTCRPCKCHIPTQIWQCQQWPKVKELKWEETWTWCKCRLWLTCTVTSS